MLPVNLNMQNRKRIFVLHRIIFIGILNGLIDDLALYISPVNKIIFKITVSSRDDRCARIPSDAETVLFIIYGKKIGGDLSPVHMIDHIPKISVAGGM